MKWHVVKLLFPSTRKNPNPLLPVEFGAPLPLDPLSIPTNLSEKQCQYNVHRFQALPVILSRVIYTICFDHRAIDSHLKIKVSKTLDSDL